MKQKLLTESNPKLRKGEKAGWQSVGVHLAPAMLGGRNVCPQSSAGCRAACLNTAGHGIFAKVQESRIAKTRRFHADPSAFVGDLVKEIGLAEKRATKKGLRLCVRLNLTSDIAWERIKWEGRTVFEHFPNVPFYDYTKSPRRMEASLAGTGDWPENYSLTFSRSEVNQAECEAVLAKGGNVAAVFAGDLPVEWGRRPVVSGDESDLRFLDPRGVVVGLSTKGSAKADKTGFVIVGNLGK